MSAVLWALAFALDLVVTVVGIGVFEGIVKPTAVRLVRGRLLKWLPAVLEYLDPMMPMAIQNYSEQELQDFVRRAFEYVTGEDWTDEEVEPFWKIYDPRKNAARVKPVADA